MTAEQNAPARGGRGARKRILDAAAELFYREGINATGVDRLAEAASVSADARSMQPRVVLLFRRERCLADARALPPDLSDLRHAIRELPLPHDRLCHV